MVSGWVKLERLCQIPGFFPRASQFLPNVVNKEITFRKALRHNRGAQKVQQKPFTSVGSGEQEVMPWRSQVRLSCLCSEHLGRFFWLLTTHSVVLRHQESLFPPPWSAPGLVSMPRVSSGRQKWYPSGQSDLADGCALGLSILMIFETTTAFPPEQSTSASSRWL